MKPLVRSNPLLASTTIEDGMRLTRIKAKNLGRRNRRASDGRSRAQAVLMQLEYEDGTTETIREDEAVEVLR